MIEWFYTGVLVITICLCFDYLVLGERLDEETKNDLKNNPQKLMVMLIFLAFMFPVVIIGEIYSIYKILKRKNKGKVKR